MKKETYTHQEVQELIKRIINQDSFGDVHWEANYKVAKEYQMDFSPDKEDPEDSDE